MGHPRGNCRAVPGGVVEPMSLKTIKCPHCDRKFAENSAVYTHIKAKHGGKGKAAFLPDDDESFADRAIQATIDRAMGIPADDDWLLP
jgi:hypothetical protein